MKHHAACLGLGLTMVFGQAQAADIKIDPPQCRVNYGTAIVEKGASVRSDGSSSATFLAGMAETSGCFTIVDSQSSPKYTLKSGTLTKAQFDKGVSGFKSAKSIISPPDTSFDNQQYAYFEVKSAKTGKLAGRAFGSNNRADLDFSGWQLPGGASERTDEALNSYETRMNTGAVVNAFFDFSTNTSKFKMGTGTASSSTVTTAAAPVPTAKTSAANLSSTSWGHQTSAVIDASSMGRLDDSLQDMLLTLSLRDQVEAMTDFFGYAFVSRCIEVGIVGEGPIKASVEERECYQYMTPARQAEKAKAYLNERRMDTNNAYTATSLAAGTSRHGRNRAESFEHFITRYGKYVNGLSAIDLAARAQDFKAKRKEASEEIRTDRLDEWRDKVARWERNYTYIPDKARNAEIAAKAQEDCRLGINNYRKIIEDVEMNRKPDMELFIIPGGGLGHPCEMIKGRTQTESLNPDYVAPTSQQDRLGLMFQSMGLDPSAIK